MTQNGKPKCIMYIQCFFYSIATVCIISSNEIILINTVLFQILLRFLI